MVFCFEVLEIGKTILNKRLTSGPFFAVQFFSFGCLPVTKLKNDTKAPIVFYLWLCSRDIGNT